MRFTLNKEKNNKTRSSSKNRKITLSTFTIFIILFTNSTITSLLWTNVIARTPVVQIKSISTIGEIKEGSNVTLVFHLYNNKNKHYDPLIIKYPNIYADSLIFDKENDTFSIDPYESIDIQANVYINCSTGDFELFFYIEKNGVLESYSVYHLLVEPVEENQPGLYNITLYNEIIVNITIKNFVTNIINNNITLYQDLFNQTFNYFNETIYHNLNTTVYNELYSDVYNKINNTFASEVYSIINNNITNYNEINNTLIQELFKYMEKEINITLQAKFEQNIQVGPSPEDIVNIILLIIGIVFGLIGMMIGNPIIEKYKREEEIDSKHIIPVKLNYRFKFGLSILTATLSYLMFSQLIAQYINIRFNLEPEIRTQLISITAAFLFGSLILSIDNYWSRQLFVCILIWSMYLLNEVIFFIFSAIYIVYILYELIKNNKKIILSKNSKSNTEDYTAYYRI